MHTSQLWKTFTKKYPQSILISQISVNPPTKTLKLSVSRDSVVLSRKRCSVVVTLGSVKWFLTFGEVHGLAERSGLVCFFFLSVLSSCVHRGWKSTSFLSVATEECNKGREGGRERNVERAKERGKRETGRVRDGVWGGDRRLAAVPPSVQQGQ